MATVKMFKRNSTRHMKVVFKRSPKYTIKNKRR